MTAKPEFGPTPEIVQSIWNINPQVLESIAQWIEQRGISTPVGQVVGYQREGFVVFIEQGTAQSIPDNTQTPLVFDTTDTDVQKAFDGTSTVTLPYAGVYLAWAQGGFSASAAGTSRNYFITQNGVSRGAADINDTAAFGERRTIATGIIAAKGDLLKFEAYQNSGAALNTAAGAAHLGAALISAYA